MGVLISWLYPSYLTMKMSYDFTSSSPVSFMKATVWLTFVSMDS